MNYPKTLIEDGQIIKKVNSIKEVYKLNMPYLFFDDGNSKRVSPVQDTYQSQYLRRIAYSTIYPDQEDDGWDWKIYQHNDKLKYTLNKFEKNTWHNN